MSKARATLFTNRLHKVPASELFQLSGQCRVLTTEYAVWEPCRWLVQCLNGCPEQVLISAFRPKEVTFDRTRKFVFS